MQMYNTFSVFSRHVDCWMNNESGPTDTKIRAAIIQYIAITVDFD